MIKRRVSNKIEASEKRKGEGLSKTDKKSKISQSNPNDKKPRDNREEKWCDECKKKHVGQCKGEVTCYRCRRPGHYSNEYMYDRKVCFECRKEGNFMKN